MKGINLNLAFNLDTIYENANFELNVLDKVGIVGVNGAGKTTLFKVILKEVELDSGKIEIKDMKVGYLPQEIIIEERDITVFNYIMNGRPIIKLENELQDLYIKVADSVGEFQEKILKKISKVQGMLEYYDYYNAENILLELISNMNIDSDLLDMRLSDLSGGQKSKVAFARLLYSKPEILLLDEPTNHLDIVTRQFITDYLKNYKGLVLMISHDVDFLNKITNKTMYIDKANKDITVFKGNYDDFIKKKEKLDEIKEKLIVNQEKEIEKLKEIVLLYSNSSGKRKRMAESREKALNKKLKNSESRDKVSKQVKINIKPSKEGGKIPVKVNDITFGYNENMLIKNLSFNVSSKERFLIVGENGVGKSTLLKLIVGILTPIEGNIWFGHNIDTAYYAQELELIDENLSVLDNVKDGIYTELELRTALGSFLFSKDDVFKKVRVLSPGEKARIALCKILLKKANLLILDEPTNHLDPDTAKIIGENFKNYEGTIIVVSHNPSFVRMIGINRMLILPIGKITNYSDERLEYYYKLNTKYE